MHDIPGPRAAIQIPPTENSTQPCPQYQIASTTPRHPSKPNVGRRTHPRNRRVWDASPGTRLLSAATMDRARVGAKDLQEGVHVIGKQHPTLCTSFSNFPANTRSLLDVAKLVHVPATRSGADRLWVLWCAGTTLRKVSRNWTWEIGKG
ncbi:uncharacterized protein N7459_000531 [Penicillium hispanicum]|uniref:uncharacterized protein n=1 Tax=Penicillium hispanicum TaxID=1080232 RepID=UPI002541AC06|nr:uncharacterized protein N7459_000531 [Penicillium hispanicum]KAJ5594323.1 hypothetical protein N7459_000531 [Penicillium hispanicum]